jgi:hypothetical protein
MDPHEFESEKRANGAKQLSSDPSNKSQELLDHAKDYVKTQEQNHEEATMEGWFDILKHDFVDGINEQIDSLFATWRIVMDWGIKKE